MTTQHRPVSVTRAGQGASASVAYAGGNWRDDAACLGMGQRYFDKFFPEDPNNARFDRYRDARAICSGCPSLLACRKDITEAEAGMTRDSRHGYAGNMTPPERYRADKPAVAAARALKAAKAKRVAA